MPTPPTPEIREKARAVALSISQYGHNPTHAIEEALAAAVAAEREACAKVAETEGTYPELNVYAGGPDWYKHGKRIAAAIRSRK